MTRLNWSRHRIRALLVFVLAILSAISSSTSDTLAASAPQVPQVEAGHRSATTTPTARIPLRAQAQAEEIKSPSLEWEQSPEPRRQTSSTDDSARTPLPAMAVLGQSESVVKSRRVPTPCSGRVDRDPRSASFVQWRPDGRQIVFSHDAELYAVGGNGTHLRHITVSRTEWRPRLVAFGELAFHVAQDSATLVYATCEYRRPGAIPEPGLADEQQDLVVASLDGQRYRRLTWTAGSESHPTWSPDGTQIAFFSSETPSSFWSWRLHLMRAHGGGVRALPAGFDRMATQTPAWSPNGRWLAVTGVGDQPERRRSGQERSGTRGAWSLHLVPITTGDEVIRLSDAVSAASWSPDGQRLAFARPDGAQVALYTIARDGTDPRRLVTIEGWQLRFPPREGGPSSTFAWISTVAWSPDGSKILYECGREICVVDADGSPLGRSPTNLGDDLLAATWSPDSSRIAVVRLGPRDWHLGKWQSEVVFTMAPDGSDVQVRVRTSAVPLGNAGIQHLRPGLDTPGGLYVRRTIQATSVADVSVCRAGLVVPDPDAFPGLVADCEALLRIQEVLAGAREIWIPYRPLWYWPGVTVDGSPKRVRGLNLGWKGLWSVVPAEVSELTELRSLNLAGNHLVGHIPPELGRLTHLTVLFLNGNELRGAIPPELGRLSNLAELFLDHNQLRGTIPVELGRLANLKVLNLAANQLTGRIPPDLGRLLSLEECNLSENQLIGPVPSGLRRLASLKSLGVAGNQLSGPIPTWLGELSNLQWLDLGRNQFTGTLPPELIQLKGLNMLHLGSNQLSGTAPPWLGQMSQLHSLDLSSNRWTGGIPAELGSLSGLYRLNLSNSHLEGPIPPSLGRLTDLSILDLSENQLTGSIPRELGQLAGLREVYLDANRLTGSIPWGLTRQRSYDSVLHLAGNQFSGCIPLEMRVADRNEIRLPNCGRG